MNTFARNLALFWFEYFKEEWWTNARTYNDNVQQAWLDYYLWYQSEYPYND